MASFSSLNDKLDLPLKQYISWRTFFHPLIVSGGRVVVVLPVCGVAPLEDVMRNIPETQSVGSSVGTLPRPYPVSL